MWSTKGSPNTNPSSRSGEEEKKGDFITFAFVFGEGFCRERVQGVKTSRRHFEVKGPSFVIRKILSRIKEDYLPDGLLEDPELVNYISNCFLQLPTDLDTLQVLFQYTNTDTDDMDTDDTDPDPQQFVVQCRWMRAMVEKQLDVEDVEDDSCAVCLEDLRIGDKVTYLPCQHFFHPKCIDQWGHCRKASCECPLCRFPFAAYFHILYFPVSVSNDDNDDHHHHKAAAAATNTSTGLESILQNYASDQDDN